MDNYNSFDYSGVSQANAAIRNTIESTPFNPISTSAGAASSFLSGVVPGLASGAISGLIGLAGSELNYNNQKKLNKQMYKINRKLAEQAFERNVQMWNLQNEYNSPSQQVARLRAAGVNPAIAFGSGNLTGNAEAAPELSYSEWNPKAPVFDVNSPLSSAISSAQLGLQAKLMESQIEKNRSDSISALSKSGYTDELKQYISKDFLLRKVRTDFENSKVVEDINLLRQATANSQMDFQMKASRYRILDKLYDWELYGAQLSATISEKAIEELQTKIDNNRAELQGRLIELANLGKRIAVELDNLSSQASLFRASKETEEERRDLTHWESIGSYYRNDPFYLLDRLDAEVDAIKKSAHLTSEQASWLGFNSVMQGAGTAAGAFVNILRGRPSKNVSLFR